MLSFPLGCRLLLIYFFCSVLPSELKKMKSQIRLIFENQYTHLIGGKNDVPFFSCRRKEFESQQWHLAIQMKTNKVVLEDYIFSEELAAFWKLIPRDQEKPHPCPEFLNGQTKLPELTSVSINLKNWHKRIWNLFLMLYHFLHSTT